MTLRDLAGKFLASPHPTDPPPSPQTDRQQCLVQPGIWKTTLNLARQANTHRSLLRPSAGRISSIVLQAKLTSWPLNDEGARQSREEDAYRVEADEWWQVFDGGKDVLQGCSAELAGGCEGSSPPRKCVATQLRAMKLA
jgi:hypothetical protein